MAGTSALQAQPSGFDEPFHYHDTTRPGFVPVLLKTPSGETEQKAIRLEKLRQELDAYAGRSDIWISQAEFFKPNRRVVNLWRLTTAFADLDTYKVDGLRSMRPEDQVAMLLANCDDKGIPPPSLVVFSGRGLQVKWLFSSPVPQRALARWQAVQRVLNAQLLEFGADKQALDASRVLRLVGTLNGRSGEQVRVLHEQRTPTSGGQLLATGLVGYDFEVFADTLLPIAREELDARRAQRQARQVEQDAIARAERDARKANLRLLHAAGTSARAPNRRILIPSELAWDRLDDLRTLARLRGFEHGAPPGQRNLFIFLGACFLSDACVVPDLLAEVVELAREFAPTWSHEELLSCVSSVMRRAQDAARGGTVTYAGLQRSARYRWKNATLVEWLGITASEERQLKTIVSKAEAQRRNTTQHTQARRAKGAKPREEYVALADQRRQQAQTYHAAGWPNSEIALALGIAPSTVSGYLKGR